MQASPSNQKERGNAMKSNLVKEMLKNTIGEDSEEYKVLTSKDTRIVNYRIDKRLQESFIDHCIRDTSSSVLRRLIFIYLQLFTKGFTKKAFFSKKWKLVPVDDVEQDSFKETTDLMMERKNNIEELVEEDNNDPFNGL
jgi:hypothetical protein